MTDTQHPGSVELPDLPVLRSRLEAQSFLNQSCDDLHELRQWWRFTPTVNWIVILTGTVLASAEILLALAALMFIGALYKSHPFDLVYNYGVRFLTGTGPLPASGQRRKIVFGVGGIMLAVLAGFFYAGWTTAGYIFGGIMIVLVGLLVVFNLCVMSEALAKLAGRPTR